MAPDSTGTSSTSAIPFQPNRSTSFHHGAFMQYMLFYIVARDGRNDCSLDERESFVEGAKIK
jgi:hypothetical protein